MDNIRLRALAGLTENYGQADLDSDDIARLDYLLTYYTKHFRQATDRPDFQTEELMNAVHALQGRNLYRLTPEEAKMAQMVLMHGAEV